MKPAAGSRGRSEKIVEHPFRRLTSATRADAPPGVLLMYGREQFLVDWAIDTLRRHWIQPAAAGFDYIRLDGAKLTVAQLIETCETLPLLSARKLVVIDDYPLLAEKSKKRAGESAEDEEGDDEPNSIGEAQAPEESREEAELIAYIGELPETCQLIFLRPTVDRRRRLYKAIEKKGACYDFVALNEGDLTAFIRKRLQTDGREASAALVRRWIEHSGYLDKVSDYTLYHFENDIKKLLDYTNNREIGWADILAVTGTNLESYVFAMIDEVAAGRTEKALRLLQRMFRSGENEYKMLSLLCGQIEVLLMVREMLDDRVAVAEMPGRIAVHEFRVRRALTWARNRSVLDCRAWFRSCCQIDRQIKTGRLPIRLALELLITDRIPNEPI